MKTTAKVRSRTRKPELENVRFEGREREYVYAVAMKYLKDEDEAADVAQDAMLNAYRHRASFRGDSRFTTWLYRVAATTALMHLRKKRRARLAFPTPDTTLEGDGTADLTLDVAWEEIKFSRAHANDFKRVAVVTTSQWVTWSAWLSQTFVNADVEVFANAFEAKAWLDAE